MRDAAAGSIGDDIEDAVQALDAALARINAASARIRTRTRYWAAVARSVAEVETIVERLRPAPCSDLPPIVRPEDIAASALTRRVVRAPARDPRSLEAARQRMGHIRARLRGLGQVRSKAA